MSVPLYVCEEAESAERRIAVAVMSSLPELRERVRAAATGADIMPADSLRTADVVLAAVPTVTDEFLAELAAQWQVAENPEQAIMLATNAVRERQLPAVFGAGVVGVVHLRDLHGRTAPSLVQAVANGQALLPNWIARWLIEDQRIRQRNLMAPADVEPNGLTRREVDVLRLVAEGMETACIAQKMNYSERTIKKVLADLMRRLDLRNRAHAVSYALRHGVI